MRKFHDSFVDTTTVKQNICYLAKKNRAPGMSAAEDEVKKKKNGKRICDDSIKEKVFLPQMNKSHLIPSDYLRPHIYSSPG